MVDVAFGKDSHDIGLGVTRKVLGQFRSPTI